MTSPAQTGVPITASWLNLAAQRTVARHRRATPSSGSTGGETPVCRIDNISVRAGLIYNYVVMCHPNSTVTSDIVRVTLRHSVVATPGAGVVATVASPIVPDGQVFPPPGPPPFIWVPWVPLVDATVSVLLCVARFSGSGSASLYADSVRNTHLMVLQGWRDPGDTGVDL